MEAQVTQPSDTCPAWTSRNQEEYLKGQVSMGDIGLPPQGPTGTWSCPSRGTEQPAHCLESAAQPASLQMQSWKGPLVDRRMEVTLSNVVRIATNTQTTCQMSTAPSQKESPRPGLSLGSVGLWALSCCLLTRPVLQAGAVATC